MMHALGFLLLLIALGCGMVVMHPRWREGPLMRLGLALMAITGTVMGVELVTGQPKSADALATAWALQCAGIVLVLLGWAVRVLLRGNLQRRHTDHGAFDDRPHHHAERRA